MERERERRERGRERGREREERDRDRERGECVCVLGGSERAEEREKQLETLHAQQQNLLRELNKKEGELETKEDFTGSI